MDGQLPCQISPSYRGNCICIICMYVAGTEWRVIYYSKLEKRRTTQLNYYGSDFWWIIFWGIDSLRHLQGYIQFFHPHFIYSSNSTFCELLIPFIKQTMRSISSVQQRAWALSVLLQGNRVTSCSSVLSLNTVVHSLYAP